MYDVTTLYDDLVAIRRTAQVMHEELSQPSRDDLQVVLERIKGKLKSALRVLSEDELEEVLEDLDREYANEARGELEALAVG